MSLKLILLVFHFCSLLMHDSDAAVAADSIEKIQKIMALCPAILCYPLNCTNWEFGQLKLSDGKTKNKENNHLYNQSFF